MINPDLGSWCEISVEAIAANISTMRQGLSPHTKLGIVVKGNAYGHGLVLCAREFVEAGVDWLVVNSAREAAGLRAAGIGAPVYICGPIFPAEAEEIARIRASAVISDETTAAALARAGCEAGRAVGVHIKVETGTNRQGVSAAVALELGREVLRLKGVRLEGLTTHFADIEDTTDHGFARSQLRILEQTARDFLAADLAVPMVHAANSAATLTWPQAHADLVRVGIAAYGLWPSRETYATVLERRMGAGESSIPKLRPVLSWKARVAQIRAVAEGEYIGYGRTFRATHPMRIAVLPVGYYEGYDRRFSNIGYALINGVRAPIRGRICMNMAMVEITHITGVEQGSIATLLGRDGEEELSAEAWADWMKSINYEAVTRIHPDQPRYLRLADGKIEQGESNG